MKKIVAAVALTLAFAVSAMAADTVTYTPKFGTITFDHKGHSGRIACKECHGEGTPAKVIVAGKEKGHALCKSCHDAKKVPGSCKGCHKK